MLKLINQTVEYLKDKGFDQPEIGIILGTGLGKLVNEINILNPYTDTVISNSRHYEALMNALKAIEEVNIGLKSDISGDLLSVDIRKSIEHLAEITGEITNDDVLGNIFANFCIGK